MPTSNGFYLHISYRGYPAKKILVNIWGLCTSKVEIKSLYNRNIFSLNRKGVVAFAVFLLSFFAEIRRMALSAVGCRSPPLNLDFSDFQNSDWRYLR